MSKRATRAKIQPLTAIAETESTSQATHGARGCPTSGEKRHTLTTTQAKNKRAVKGFKPRHGTAAAIHASHTPHSRREDEPRRSTNAAQIPNAAHRWRGTRSRRACRAYEKSRFPYPFFFSLGFIYILYFLCFFLSFLAAIARKPRIYSHFLRMRRGSRRRSERESRTPCAHRETESGKQAAALVQY